MLTARRLPEDCVAQIDHVSLVRVRTRAATHGGPLIRGGF
jgi:hypothetical protein